MDWIDLIVLFVVCIVEIYLIFDFFNNYFELRNSISRHLVFIICTITICVLYAVNLLENTYVNLIFVPIIIWVFLYVLFDTNLKSRFIYFIFTYLILMSAEFLYSIISGFSTRVADKEEFVPLSDNMWQVIAVKLLDYILFIIVKQLLGNSKRHMTGKIFTICLCLPIATLGTMVTTFYSGVDFSNNLAQRILMTLFFILMLAGSILMFYVFSQYSEEVYQNSEKKVIIMRQKADLNYLLKSIDINDKHKEIIHNTSNYLKTIGELATTGECEKIVSIIKEINGELEKSKIVLYSSHTVLNYLLSEKETDSSKKNVKFNVYVEPDISFGEISDMDLISMIGNLLDNAIRAAEICKSESGVSVKIFMQNEGSVCIVKIINNYVGEVKVINGQIVSTKVDSGIHGLGIKSVKNTAEKYDGYLDCSYNDNKFTAILVLPIK